MCVYSIEKQTQQPTSSFSTTCVLWLLFLNSRSKTKPPESEVKDFAPPVDTFRCTIDASCVSQDNYVMEDGAKYFY